MPRSRPGPPWYVDHGTSAKSYSLFISYVSEDEHRVEQLAAALESGSTGDGGPPLTCFLAMQSWRLAIEPRQNIREALLASEHMVVWATQNYLAESKRGWVWFELAYADLIDQSLHYDSTVQTRLREYPFVIPLFLRITSPEIERTPQLSYWQQKVFRPDRPPSVSRIAALLLKVYRDNHPAEARRSGESDEISC